MNWDLRREPGALEFNQRITELARIQIQVRAVMTLPIQASPNEK